MKHGFFRSVVIAATATAMACTLMAAPAQAVPAIDVEYATSCGHVTVFSDSSTKVSVYYGGSAVASDLSAADGMAILDQYEFDTVATVRSTLYVTAIAYGSTPSSWTTKTLSVPQTCTGVQSKVTVAGTRRVGKTLKAKLVGWVPKPLFTTYQWYRSGKAITNATASRYTLRAADRGDRITVKVHATFIGYKSVTRTSKSTSPIRRGILTTSRPHITIDGWTATAWAGTWGPSPLLLSYQWYLGSKKLKGETSGLLSVHRSWVGKTISVRVSGEKTGYVKAYRLSKPFRVTGSE